MKETIVIHGWDIQILSPALEFLKNNDSYRRNVQRESVLTRHGSKFEAKTTMPVTKGRFVWSIKRMQYLD